MLQGVRRVREQARDISSKTCAEIINFAARFYLRMMISAARSYGCRGQGRQRRVEHEEGERVNRPRDNGYPPLSLNAAACPHSILQTAGHECVRPLPVMRVFRLLVFEEWREQIIASSTLERVDLIIVIATVRWRAGCWAGGMTTSGSVRVHTI
ncbi:hypothetical protein BDU57DRAFT_113592 [Ampelomyces quisqualis]|uniref:Uncharacterized protein n=1 Tax=Ampelomyces quisqualis TaxID=50730 RepID=A0A6A5Q4D2_AMPQU|nr:hypothetical protein BDU57DRAFT_113592 [Ampelomyces quisqualis]